MPEIVNQKDKRNYFNKVNQADNKTQGLKVNYFRKETHITRVNQRFQQTQTKKVNYSG